MTTTRRSDRLRRTFASLADPHAVPHIAVVTVLAGVLALRNPAAQTTAGRLSLRFGSAALSGFVAWVGLRDWKDDFFRRPLRAGFTAAAVGAALALAEASDTVDAKLHRGLVRRGVAHPRAVLAGVAAIAMALSYLPGRDSPAPSSPDDDQAEDEVTVELPDDVRRLVEALLSASDLWGAPELRGQLAVARAVEYRGEDEAAFYPGIGFSVPDTLPRAVPHDASFPVVGRYHPLGGRSADVTLAIAGGHIAHLHIGQGADWTSDDEIAWITSGGSMQDIPHWPAPDDLTLLIETAEGLTPLSHRSTASG